MHPVSQTLVVFEMNLTSSFLFYSDQLEYCALARLFCIIFASGFAEAVGFRGEP